MSNGRLGFVAVLAGLLVACAIGAMVLGADARDRRAALRGQGFGMVRTLASLSPQELDAASNPRGSFQQILRLHRAMGTEVAFAQLLDSSSRVVSEFATPGVRPTALTIPPDPAQWTGERLSPGAADGREIREYYGPVLREGDLAGLVRIGFFEPRILPVGQRAQFMAMLALPVLLLAGGLYAMVTRETRRLYEINRKIGAGAESAEAPEGRRNSLEQFALRLERYLRATEQRLHALETDRDDAVAASKLLVYHKERVESALRMLPEGALIVDENGVATYANDKLGPLIGVEAADLIGRPLDECSLPEQVRAALARARSRTGGTGCAHHLSDPGGRRRVTFRGHALPAPRDPARKLGTLILAHDSSEELLAARARDEFIEQAAHELKTPLANVVSYTETLLSTRGTDEAGRVEALNVIHDEAERMVALIENLLSISRVEAGSAQLSFGRIRLQEMLGDCLERARHHLRARSMSVRLEASSDLGAWVGDKALLRIAIDNLLSNAIKYNRPDGELVLAAQAEPDGVTIAVRDSGIGIEPQDQQRIFEKFFRASGRGSQERGGHGLGLYLVKQIVELHHGSIAVRSEPGKGAEFMVRLPRVAALLREAA